MTRLLATTKYTQLFKSAFPQIQDLNIGHLASALAHFQTHQFSVYETPWDKYLSGDKNALSEQEKNGAWLFFTNGRCFSCHGSSTFGGTAFRNIVSPQIGPGKDSNHDDTGLFLITNNPMDKYAFKVPPLRNVAFTAPYFHSGVYENLEQVIEHYTQGVDAINYYDDTWLRYWEENYYGRKFFVEKVQHKLAQKKHTAHPIIRNSLISLTESDKKDLILFLKESLSDQSYLKIK